MKLYTNQAGGYACQHPEVRGEKALLGAASALATPEYLAGLQERLMTHFTGEKWKGWCDEGIDEETALFVEAAFWPILPGLVVNRDKLADSMEAWIYATWQGQLLVLAFDNSD